MNIFLRTGYKLEEDSIGGQLTRQDIQILRSIQFTPQQFETMQKFLVALGHYIISGTLGVIDGISYSDEFDLPVLKIINNETGQDIADDRLLNEEYARILEE